jgi:RND superfamily putative drug exporter
MLIKSKKPLAVAILVVIAWFGVSGIFGPLFGKLSTVQENNNSSFLPKGAEATLALDEIQKFSDGVAFNIPTLVLFEGDVSDAVLSKINAHLTDVPSLTVGEGTEKVSDYLLPGIPITAFSSPDGEAILVNLPLDGESLGKVLEDGEPVLPAMIEALREDFSALADELSLQSYVTGPGGIFGDLFSAFGSIDTTLLLTTLGVVAIILVFVYRSPVLWIIPLLSAIFALSLSGGIVYLLASADIIDVDGQSQGILSILVVGAATDYALLLIARYREELHLYENRFDAMRAAYKGVWEPILASGSTVAISLLMLLFSQLSNSAGLGPVGAIGIVSAVITILTLLPALLLVPSIIIWLFTLIFSSIALIVARTSSISTPIRIIVPAILLSIVITSFYQAIQRVRKPETSRFNRDKFREGRWIFWPRTPEHDGADEMMSGLWSKIASTVARRPRRAWVITGASLLILAFFSTTLKADGIGTVDSFTTRPESVIGQELLVKHFPGGEGDPTQIVVSQGNADAVLAAVSEIDGVSEVVYAVDPMTQNVKSVGGKVILNATLDQAPDSVEAGRYIPGIREAAHKADPGSLVGGTSAVNYDIRQANDRDNKTIIPIILFVITLILGLLLRSILSALLLLGTVVLSYFAALGVSALVFNHIFGFAGGDNAYPLFAFIFLVALGIDYNIFLMTRVREESGKIGTRAGITKGITVTGGVITSAGVVLAATFAVLGLIPLVPLAQLGFTVAFGVLLDTIIVRSILVPALSHDIGRKIWWPSKLARAQE